MQLLDGLDKASTSAPVECILYLTHRHCVGSLCCFHWSCVALLLPCSCCRCIVSITSCLSLVPTLQNTTYQTNSHTRMARSTIYDTFTSWTHFCVSCMIYAINLRTYNFSPSFIHLTHSSQVHEFYTTWHVTATKLRSNFLTRLKLSARCKLAKSILPVLMLPPPF